VRGTLPHILKEFARQDKKSLSLDHIFPDLFGLGIGKLGVVKVGVPCFVFPLIDVVSKVFGDIPVEQHAKHILLEIPAIDAAPQVVSNIPDCLIEFGTLLFTAVWLYLFIILFMLLH